jgi:translation initiation factor IF-1
MEGQEQNKNQKVIKKEGQVTEALPNAFFKIKLQDGNEITGFLSGKMRMHKIRILIGDRVEMIIDPYGGKARIIKRL